jgi:CRP-like cAMP-binding protein
MNTTNDPEAILLSYFQKFKLSPESVSRISSLLKPLHIKKGDVFSEIGRKTNRLGILVSGLLYARYESKKSEEEVVSRFYYVPRNIIVTSFESFYNDSKANETIEAIEESYLLYLTKDELYNLYKSIPEMNIIGRELAEQSYIQALQRIHDLQALTVEDRVKEFFKDHSEIYNRVQRKHLCSYLGTNRNSLARYLGKE